MSEAEIPKQIDSQMVIGVLTVFLDIPGSSSLKDKRQVLRSLLDGLRRKYNVSAAELDSLDSRRRATIGVTIVSNDKVFANQVLNSAMGRVESDPRVTTLDYTLEFL